MNAAEFFKTHKCSDDFVLLMAGRDVIVLNPGQQGMCNGFPATVLRHYWNGMYEIRVPGGVVCVGGSEFSQ